MTKLACAKCGRPFERVAAEHARQVRRQRERRASAETVALCGRSCAQAWWLEHSPSPLWSAADDQYLRDHWQTTRHKDMAAAVGRTKAAVSLRCKKLGLTNDRRMTVQQETLILTNYKRLRTAELANRTGLSRGTVTHFLARRGLTLKPRRRVEGELEGWVRELYDRGFNDAEICETTGLSRPPVVRWRRKHGLEPRRYTERSRARIAAKSGEREHRDHNLTKRFAAARLRAAELGWPQAQNEDQARILSALVDGPVGIDGLVSAFGDMMTPLLQLLRTRLVVKVWSGDWRQRRVAFALGPKAKHRPADPNPDINVADHFGIARLYAIRLGADPRAVHDSWQFSEALLGLAKAKQTFKPEKGFKFATWAGTLAKNQILAELKRRGLKYQKFEDSIGSFGDFGFEDDEPASILATSTDPEPNEPDPATPADDLLRLLDERSRRLVRLVVMQGWSADKAGKAEDPPISRARVYQLVEAAKERMRERAPAQEA